MLPTPVLQLFKICSADTANVVKLQCWEFRPWGTGAHLLPIDVQGPRAEEVSARAWETGVLVDGVLRLGDFLSLTLSFLTSKVEAFPSDRFHGDLRRGCGLCPAQGPTTHRKALLLPLGDDEEHGFRYPISGGTAATGVDTCQPFWGHERQ